LKDLGKLDPLRCGVFRHDLGLARDAADLFWPLLLIAVCLFPFDVAVRRLRLEPEAVLNWVGEKLGLALFFLRRKKEALAQAAAAAAARRAEDRSPPPPIVPSGTASKEARSRYEQAGGTEAAEKMDLQPQPQPPRPAAVGGHKLSQADPAASEYTRQLLKAKRRARKEQSGDKA
jgi:hypothetical protein